MEENKEKTEKEKDLEKTNEIKAKIMLEELKLKYPIFNNSILVEDDIIKKIIELNFNEDKIKNYCDIDIIYEELDRDLGISGFFPEEEVKDKIVQLNFDKDRIIDWIENKLLNV